MNSTGTHEDDGATVGTAAWVERTSNHLTAGERRRLPRPLARTHLFLHRFGAFAAAVKLAPYDE